MKVLVLVAHSDDQVLGPGGTVAKYAAEGATIKTVIFSYGELSHPHYKPEDIRKVREEESDKADKILGTHGVEFLGIPDGKIVAEQKNEEFKEIIRKILLKEKPQKIFTHANDEAHPDHIAVHNIVLEVYDKLHEEGKLTSSIYSFGIWRFFKYRHRQKPRLIVDVTQTFTKKLDALKMFKSQKVAMLTLTWSVYVKAIINGFKHKKNFVEVFYKLR